MADNMPNQFEKDMAAGKADLAGVATKPAAPALGTDIDKLIEEEAAQYREFTLVHSRSATVFRVATALAKLDDAAVEVQAKRFHVLTGFSAGALVGEVARLREEAKAKV